MREPRFIQLEVTWYEFIGPKIKQFVTFDTVNEIIVDDEEEWDLLGDTAVEIPSLKNR